ncbi:MAG TPA: hypothetical protein VGD56_17830 [Gemmatirosa sp.]
MTITVVAAAACGGKDPYAPVATYDTIATTFTVYPLRAAPPPYGSALDLHTPLTPSVVRPQLIAYTSTSGTTTIAPNFDVAFDLDSVGNILVYPPKLITSSLAAPRTAFQTSTTAYTSLGNAPDGTYQADSVIRVKVGQSVVVQAQGLSCSTGAPFYAKFVVDSISALTSALYLRATIDQNCGFKSFAAGLPTS